MLTVALIVAMLFSGAIGWILCALHYREEIRLYEVLTSEDAYEGSMEDDHRLDQGFPD